MITTKKQGTLEYLTAEEITVPHAFTTRFGGISTGPQESLNLAFGNGDTMENVEANLRLLAKGLGFDPKALVLTRQTHSDIVRVVSRADHQGFCHREYPECDALCTDDPGTALLVFTADCTPILFYDPVTGAVGAAHAGWRGTAAGIAGKVVETMTAAFGTDPADLRCAIGPNVGICHFETDADVPEAMLAAFGDDAAPYISKTGEKYHLDLKAINAMVLRRAGVTHIEISGECTMCQSQRFWSHRVTQGIRGSQGAVIVCQEVRR